MSDKTATARLSVCGKYRYTLTRPARISNPSAPPAVFCLLNPSKASADVDDPTIIRCWGFADRWGCDGLVVINAYALRSTDPDNLWIHTDPIGPDNDEVLGEIGMQYPEIVCGWGTNIKPDRARAVADILTDAGAKLFCLAVTKNGSAKHPLYIRADQHRIPFFPRLDIQ